MGHSLGGSVCVRAVPLLLELKYKLTGVAVLDVVEGETGPSLRSPTQPALPQNLRLMLSLICIPSCIRDPLALQVSRKASSTSMDLHHLLSTRTKSGHSVKTNAIRNPTSARISIPSILTPSTSGNPPAHRWRTPLEDTAPYWTSELILHDVISNR